MAIGKISKAWVESKSKRQAVEQREVGKVWTVYRTGGGNDGEVGAYNSKIKAVRAIRHEQKLNLEAMSLWAEMKDYDRNRLMDCILKVTYSIKEFSVK